MEPERVLKEMERALYGTGTGPEQDRNRTGTGPEQDLKRMEQAFEWPGEGRAGIGRRGTMRGRRTFVMLAAAAAVTACIFMAGQGGTYRVSGEESRTVFIDDPPAIEAAAASVVKLEVYDKRDERIAFGSGFCAIDPGILVTATHVAVNMKYIIATRDDGSTFRIDEAFYADKERDLAFLALPEDAGLAPLPCAEEPPMRGERAAAIGSQFGCVNLVSMGNICGSLKAEDMDWMLFTCPVSSGNSGGPVFDARGNVTGIVSGTYDKGQNLNLAVPVTDALKIYEEYSGYNEKDK